VLTQAEYDAVMQAIEQSKNRAEIVLNMIVGEEQRAQFTLRRDSLVSAAKKMPDLGIVEKPKRRYVRRKKEAAA
jgi:hypothetical protein